MPRILGGRLYSRLPLLGEEAEIQRALLVVSDSIGAKPNSDSRACMLNGACELSLYVFVADSVLLIYIQAEKQS